MDSKEGIQCNSPDENAERHKSSFFPLKKANQWLPGMGGLTAKKHKGIFWSHKNVLYRDCSGGYACMLSRFSHV